MTSTLLSNSHGCYPAIDNYIGLTWFILDKSLLAATHFLVIFQLLTNFCLFIHYRILSGIEVKLTWLFFPCL